LLIIASSALVGVECTFLKLRAFQLASYEPQTQDKQI